MMTKRSQIWASTLLLLSLPGFGLSNHESNGTCTIDSDANDDSNKYICERGNYTRSLACKVVCNGGQYDQQCSGKEYCNMQCSGTNCTQRCNLQGSGCNLQCSGKKCTQRCYGQGRGCNMTCSGDECSQQCSGNGYCGMQCSGKKCTQRCNGQGRGCNMTCSGEECDQYCDKKEDCNMQCNGTKCSQRCNGQVKGCNMSCSGREKCSQLCNGTEDCILRCSRKRCDQRCKGQVKSSNMTCGSGECDQDSDEMEDCNKQCSGENCTQRCNGQLDKCNMPCNGSTCDQTCRAQTCSMTRHGFRNRLTKQICQGGNGSCFQHIRIQCRMGSFHFKCDRSDQCKASKLYSTDCITSVLYTSNAIKTATVTTIQAIATQIPTLQVPLHPSSPKSLSLLLPSPSSTPSSSSSPLLLSSSPPPQLSPLESIKNLVKESLSKFIRIEIRSNSSMQEAITLFEDFTDQYMNISESRKDELGLGEIKTIRESVFRVAVAFEEFALNYGKYHLSGKEPSKKIIRQKMVLSIQKGYRQNSTDFALEEKEWRASINVSSANFAENGSVVIGCVYKELHELLQTNQLIGNENDNLRYVNTRIMTAAMDPKPEKLQQDVILKFKNLKVVDGKKHCMFWSGLGNSPNGFSGNGCHIDSATSNSEETVCRCNHLTHFAVLVDFSGGAELSTKDLTILEIITYAGLSLSVIGMLLTIALYFFFTDVRQPLSQIRLSLSVALGAGQIIFLAGINATENTAVCVTVAALMQYFLMAAFCWMLVEGIYLYLFVVKVYNINTKMHMYHVMSWGSPVIMVAISLSIAAKKDGIQNFTSDEYCWISSTRNLIWIFVAFVIMIEVINILILARVIREMARMQPIGDKQIQQIRIGIRACVVMIPVLGVTWLFGLLSPLHKAFVYIFTILNSSQGFLIFALHCVRNSQIRERFKRKVSTVFPFTKNGSSTKKSSQVYMSDIGGVRAVKLQFENEFELKKFSA